MTYLSSFFKDTFLLKKILFLFVGIILFRVIAAVPLPIADTATLANLLSDNALLGVFNLFSGGALSQFSIAMLGVIPYITVSIIIQLLTSVVPTLHSMYHEEGEIGRSKINQWTRMLAIPVSAINAIGILLYFKSQGIFPSLDVFNFIVSVVLIVAGSALVMWIGELITEFGIGNGISLLVFVSIVVNIPTVLNQLVINQLDALTYLLLLVIFFLFVMVSVWMNDADRPVPASYARFGVSQSVVDRRTDTYIPIKVNSVGVISIIFSLTIYSLLQFISRFFQTSDIALVSSMSEKIYNTIAIGWVSASLVFVLTVAFTYFYAPISFNTKKISESLQKQGAFIPSKRPGEETVAYFDTLLYRITLYASVFLAIIAASPYLLTDPGVNTLLITVGGTSLLIIVSVVFDIYKKIYTRISVI
ncbi:MAG: preprotein translocase subunit SecY [Alphaproteobacteria bacterium]|nr:preprotein translocase subunit SecY [Alphaproteobacteria bacterium]